MLIQYASNHRWVKDIHEDIFPDFGKNNTKKINKLLGNLAQCDISYKFSPLDEDTLSWFVPQYQYRISKKNNPRVLDIYASTLGKTDAPYPYFCLTLFEKDQPIGGTIFTLRENRLSISFRSYADIWSQHEDIVSSPALFAEYLITVHAQENGKKRLVHGKDKNPYGMNSSIGVAIFKLSVGCWPQLQKPFETHEIDLTTCAKNILVLKKPDKARIREAFLVTTRADEKKYEQILKYPERLAVTTVMRD